jgi:2-oxoglutarate dehydrogenase E2 component (dihydrolipoamide succinyltransferase)
MAVDIVIPAVGESVTSGVVQRWVKKDGEFVQQDEVIMELETDKVTAELRAPASGTLQTLVKEGETVAVGAVVGRVAEGAGKPVAAPAKAAIGAEPKPTPPPAKAAVATAAPAQEHGGDDVRATPLARKLAAEHGVDLSKINGSGPGQRVREQDVLDFVQAGRNGATTATRAPAPATTSASPKATAGTAVPPPGSRGISRERMSPLRQRIAARLVQAQHTAAMLTTFNECDMTAVMDLRKQYKEDFEKKHGIGLGFMSFFVKAVVGALRAFPKVNSFIVEDEGVPAIENHDYCDVAVAVSTPKGLVVPVLRNSESLSFAAIEQGIKDLATRAKDGKLELADMQGGTFTITNGGIFGSLNSTPILNPPQSAILGMHAIKNRPIEYPAASGQIALRPMMYLALSYDHRIIDGSEAVQFLVRIKQGIEDPQRLLLEV